MTRPCRIAVSGPLAEFAAGFAAELAGLGYSSRSIRAQLGLMDHVSVWLAAQGLSVGDLTVEVVERFVVVRRQMYTYMRSGRALVPLLGFLRGQGVAPVPRVALPAGPVEVLSGRFARYLSLQRGVAPATVRSYVSQVQPFLAWHGEHHGGRWETLTAGQVAQFTVVRAAGQRPRSVQVGLNALRALLRWLWLEGVTPAPLADTVGPCAAPSPTALPKALTSGQVSDLIAGLSADRVARLRDEAMLALMWRMGLRAGEVASMRLEDIAWRVGVIVVRGKGDRREQVPLPVDVGGLLAAYLSQGRPGGGTHRHVFLALDAPHRPLVASSVSYVVARAAARAGIPGRCGAHRLRHTAACRVLAGGGGLVEAGQLLRHTSTAATAVYAKSDLLALAVLARPWPGGAGR